MQPDAVERSARLRSRGEQFAGESVATGVSFTVQQKLHDDTAFRDGGRPAAVTV
jgi:hypothetical protein